MAETCGGELIVTDSAVNSLSVEENDENLTRSEENAELEETSPNTLKSVSNKANSIEREIAEIHQCETRPDPLIKEKEEALDDKIDTKVTEQEDIVDLQSEAVAAMCGTDKIDNSDTKSALDVIASGISQIDAGVALDQDELIAVLKGIDATKDEQVADKPCAPTTAAPGDTNFPSVVENDLAEGVTIEGEGQFQILEVIDDEVVESASFNEVKSEPAGKVSEDILTPDSGITNATQRLTPEQERAMAMEQIATLQSRDRQRRRKQDIKLLQLDTDANISVWKDNSPSCDGTSNSAKVSTFADDAAAGSEKTAAGNVAEDAVKDNSPVSTAGYKRTRIIKRKIIWDPDAPETGVSYAHLVRKEPKNILGLTPDKPSAVQKVQKMPAKRAYSKKQSSNELNNQNQLEEATAASQKADFDVAQEDHDDKSFEPSSLRNGVHLKKKKISEIDRLMGDEGAANMITSLKTEQTKIKESPSDKLRMRNRSATPSEKRDSPATAATAAALNAVKGKRGPKPKTSTWDYVYQQKLSDDSMIVRRHSSSSHSSKASLHLSSDTLDEKTLKIPISPSPSKKSAKSVAKKSLEASTSKKNMNRLKQQSKVNNRGFEFAKPYTELNPKTNRNTLMEDTKLTDVEHSDATRRSSRAHMRQVEKTNFESDFTHGKNDFQQCEVFAEKFDNVTQITISTHSSKQEYTFSAKLMVNLCNVLHELSDDPNCDVVVIITNAPHFCQGIDFKGLLDISPQKRENAALDIATAAKNYLKTLATFPKPLIAAVNGNNVNLGVTQLPLFDVVVGSEQCTYETNYASIGQVPEGFCIWNNMAKISDSYKTKLFWLCEKLTAAESVSSGLVNILAESESVNRVALETAKMIASKSAETFISMKKTCANKHLDVIFTPLNEEFDAIVQRWTANNCSEILNKNKFL